MSETFQRIRTASLTVLVSVLALTMFQFGAQLPSCDATAAPGVALTVGDRSVSSGEFDGLRALVARLRRPPSGDADAFDRRTRAQVAEGIIERILLAREASDLGFDIEDEDLWVELIGDDAFRVTLPPETGFPPLLRLGVRDDDGVIQREAVENTVRGLRMGDDVFLLWQREEWLAHRMRQAVASTVQVSNEEVWDAHLAEAETVSFRYVHFRSNWYRETLDPTEEQLAAFMGEHETEINAEYERSSARYTGLPEQVEAWQILVRAPESEGDEARAAARTRATELRRRVTRGGEDFLAVARAESQDSATAARGGRLGFVRRGQRDAAITDALFAMEPGAISDVLETAQGYVIIKAGVKREGDVPEADAKREIAISQWREANAEEATRAAAAEALAFLREGHTPDELNARLTGVAPGESASSLPFNAPQVRQANAVTRTRSVVSGAFDGRALNTAVFAQDPETPLPEEPLTLGSDAIIWVLEGHEIPTPEGLDDEAREEIRTRLLNQKRSEAIERHTAALLAEANAAGEVLQSPTALGTPPAEATAGDEDADDE